MRFNHLKYKVKKYLLGKIIGKVVEPPMECETNGDGLHFCRNERGKSIFLF